MRRIFLSLLLIVCGAGTWGGLEVLRWWEEPLTVPEGGYVLQVEAGQTLSGVAKKLSANPGKTPI